MAAKRALVECGLGTLTALILSILVVSVPTAAAPQTTRQNVSAGVSIPRGLVVVIDPTAPDSQWRRAVKNPYINGVAVQVNWRDLEPMKGKPDWSKLDDVFAAAKASKKWMHLLIFPGFFSPSS